MNVANLQLEGLIMAVASINKALVEKGLLSVAEIDMALSRAEATLTGDDRVSGDMSPSNRDAVCFPVRVLKQANLGSGSSQPFSELAKLVGQNKEPYNDQR